MAQKPSIPKGTRDFSPEQMSARGYIFDTIKRCFSLFGFAQIETPSMENLSTLMGKYGEEGDRLIFKILNSGDFMDKVSDEFLESKNSLKITNSISEKALRYDLTVPFARYVVQHQNEITFPFKRFQMQPVWRADRPQKGRFREFYQCDADVVGSTSLWQEVELIQLYDEVFTRLGLPVSIKINNRKILSALAEITSQADKIIDITVALDKLDKIGEDSVVAEMLERGVSQEAVEIIRPFMQVATYEDMWMLLENTMLSSEIGRKGLEELRFIFDKINSIGLQSATLDLDLTLARGLNYYTGAIFEVKARGVEMGSIGGGGRYDDLTGIFGMKNVSGVGISFGLDRVQLVLEELDKFPKGIARTADVLFTNMGEEEALYATKAISELRKEGIKAELYPDNAKIGKQMDFANKKEIPYVVICGTKELEETVYTVKNMESGGQKTVDLDSLIDIVEKQKFIKKTEQNTLN